ncbi:YpdA family putative bacillithiol disulfide reductase [candidate division KSB1 bacterium]|nr:YpdA family putative bacillithiol disulfide reductase [candidate division KSB1 bacterium]
MTTAQEVNDVAIVGAGPGGLACAIAAQKHNLNYLVIEKGCLVNSVFYFPTNTTLFSTPELLEIGGIPFIIPAEKPSRRDLLGYYRRVTQHFDLKINLNEKVGSISGQKGNFQIQTSRDKIYSAKNIVIATGQYDTPNLMSIPGEDLEKVSHYYTEAHSYYRKKVAIIGGKNSAVEAALDLYRHDAKVTVIHRGDDFGKSVKYWILPDIKNRVKEGKIHAYFNTTVKEINEDSLIVEKDGVETELENDFVFALTGYRPDMGFLKNAGVEFDSKLTPVHDAETFETNVPGVYIAGVIIAGCEGSKVFIENTRNHGTKIIGHINGSNV